MKTKDVTVVPYQDKWPVQFQEEAEHIRAALGAACVDVYHIGSTSVLGLAAKDTLDVLCVVKSLSASLNLEKAGYAFKGELNVPLRYYFSKRTPELRVNLHVVEPEHGFIELNIKFRDYLRNHTDARDAYMQLKYSILNEQDAFLKQDGQFVGYTLKKNAFIKAILNAAGVRAMLLNFCMHESEWDTLESMLNIETPDDKARYFCFVLYEGTQIVGAAMFETLNNKNLRLLGLKAQSVDYRQGLILELSKWIQHHGYQADALKKFVIN